MHVMSASWIDADRANMVQTLDQPEHRGRLCRFRHLAQPDEPALTRFRAALRQSIETIRRRRHCSTTSPARCTSRSFSIACGSSQPARSAAGRVPKGRNPRRSCKFGHMALSVPLRGEIVLD